MRDLDNGRPIKDLDIFYNEETVSDHALQSVISGRYVHHNQCNGAYIDAASEILFTTVFHDLHGGPDLNLINVAPDFDPLGMLQRMDFGICLIGFNGEQVIRTAEYMRDQADHTFTLTRADNVAGVIRSLKRYERLSQKYDGWELVVPEHLKETTRLAIEQRKIEGEIDEIARAEQQRIDEQVAVWEASLLTETFTCVRCQANYAVPTGTNDCPVCS
jgi:hypothetical protein